MTPPPPKKKDAVKIVLSCFLKIRTINDLSLTLIYECIIYTDSSYIYDFIICVGWFVPDFS